MDGRRLDKPTEEMIKNPRNRQALEAKIERQKGRISKREKRIARKIQREAKASIANDTAVYQSDYSCFNWVEKR